jgi:uncharacterized membrane protein
MKDTQLPTVSTFRLWFGLFGAPVTWSVHFLLIWSVVEMGCGLGLENSQLFSGINMVHGLVLLLTLVALILIGLIMFTAYRNWQYIKAEERQFSKQVADRVRFMALTGMGFGLLFLLVVLYVTLPVFVLPPCNL